MKKSWLIHKCLRAIDHSTLLSKLKPDQFADQAQVMLKSVSLRECFQLYPEIIDNTEWMLDQLLHRLRFQNQQKQKNIQ